MNARPPRHFAASMFGWAAFVGVGVAGFAIVVGLDLSRVPALLLGMALGVIWTAFDRDFPAVLTYADAVSAFSQLQHLIEKQGAKMDAQVKQLVDAVNSLRDAFAPLPDAINALEAAVTAANLSAEDRAAISDAIAGVKAVSDGVTAAVADAKDGVDEGASSGDSPPAGA